MEMEWKWNTRRVEPGASSEWADCAKARKAHESAAPGRSKRKRARGGWTDKPTNGCFFTADYDPKKDAFEPMNQRMGETS